MAVQDSVNPIVPTSIDQRLLEQTSRTACTSPRKRMNHNFHQPEDVVQRFLNAIEPDSYIQPHRHINPSRAEVFLVLRGSGALINFSDSGEIRMIHLLDTQAGFWGIDIPGGIYHSIISTQPGSVFYEIKPGPYQPDADKGYAPWAPAEGSTEAASYLKSLQTAVKNFKTIQK